MLLTIQLLAWVLIIDPLAKGVPTDAPKTRFDTPEACNAAMADFIQKNMTTNWQGLKMAPLVRTKCVYKD